MMMIIFVLLSNGWIIQSLIGLNEPNLQGNIFLQIGLSQLFHLAAYCIKTAIRNT
jgi:hypothetical protein